MIDAHLKLMAYCFTNTLSKWSTRPEFSVPNSSNLQPARRTGYLLKLSARTNNSLPTLLKQKCKQVTLDEKVEKIMILTPFHIAISPLIMVRFEKFKNWLVAENKPDLQDGLDPLFARPYAFYPPRAEGRALFGTLPELPDMYSTCCQAIMENFCLNIKSSVFPVKAFPLYSMVDESCNELKFSPTK